MYFGIYGLLALALGFPPAFPSDITIPNLPAYHNARIPVQDCLSGGHGAKDLAFAIECPQRDECLCNPSLRPAATAYLSRCIYTRFTGLPSDYTTAVWIYDNYCGFTAAAAAATASPTKPSSNSSKFSQSVKYSATRYLLRYNIVTHY